MSGPSFTFPPRAAITTRHQESVKPRKITQTLGNVKSLPPFINRKNSKHETTTTEKEEEEDNRSNIPISQAEETKKEWCRSSSDQ
jgi:hypothetical protein